MKACNASVAASGVFVLRCCFHLERPGRPKLMCKIVFAIWGAQKVVSLCFEYWISGLATMKNVNIRTSFRCICWWFLMIVEGCVCLFVFCDLFIKKCVVKKRPVKHHHHKSQKARCFEIFFRYWMSSLFVELVSGIV